MSLNRREIVAVCLAGALLIASPAIAHHVSVPTAALLGIEFRLAEYSTGTPAECGDTVSFRNLRIEQFATVEAKPSEHWTTRVGWSKPRGLGSDYVLWPHQNIGPHGTPNIGHAQMSMPFPGDYQIHMTSQGDESDNRFELVCQITRR